MAIGLMNLWDRLFFIFALFLLNLNVVKILKNEGEF